MSLNKIQQTQIYLFIHSKHALLSLIKLSVSCHVECFLSCKLKFPIIT